MLNFCMILLDSNPSLTAKPICELLGLPYVQYCRYVAKLKRGWKFYCENKLGSNCSSVHGWRGYCSVPFTVKRDLAADSGWIRSKSRNRFLLWKDNLGRMEWFETERVNLYVRSPISLGRIKHLICKGFFETNLISDVKLLDQVLATIRFKQAHYVFDSDQPLPNMTIDYFEKSHGLVFKLGDKSHRKAVEVVTSCPDWTNTLESCLEKIHEVLTYYRYETGFSRKSKYVV